MGYIKIGKVRISNRKCGISESRKSKFGNEKCAYWKSEIRKFQFGNEKYPN